MNCDNCGAPLTPVEGRGYFRCDHCTTFQFPEELENSSDGIAPLGESCEVDCPVCELPLAMGVIDGYTLLYCGKCRGVLTSNTDFVAILRKRRSRQTGQLPDPAPLNPEELKRRLDCPACRERMDTHPYHGPGNVVIDTCRRCRLIWFDSGEITALVQAPQHKARPTEPTLFGRMTPQWKDRGDFDTGDLHDLLWMA